MAPKKNKINFSLERTIKCTTSKKKTKSTTQKQINKDNKVDQIIIQEEMLNKHVKLKSKNKLDETKNRVISDGSNFPPFSYKRNINGENIRITRDRSTAASDESANTDSESNTDETACANPEKENNNKQTSICSNSTPAESCNEILKKLLSASPTTKLENGVIELDTKAPTREYVEALKIIFDNRLAICKGKIQEKIWNDLMKISNDLTQECYIQESEIKKLKKELDNTNGRLVEKEKNFQEKGNENDSLKNNFQRQKLELISINNKLQDLMKELAMANTRKEKKMKDEELMLKNKLSLELELVTAKQEIEELKKILDLTKTKTAQKEKLKSEELLKIRNMLLEEEQVSATQEKELISANQELQEMKQTLELMKSKNKELEHRNKFLSNEETRQQFEVQISSEKLRQNNHKISGSEEALLIYPKENSMSSSIIESNIKRRIDPLKEGIKINRIKTIKNNGLVISIPTLQDKQKLMGTITRYPNLLSSIIIKHPKKRDPHIIVYDVPNEIDPEYINSTLLTAINEPQTSNIIKILFSIKESKSTSNWVISIEPTYFNSIMKLKKIYLGWSSNRIREFLSVTRCGRCSRHGHTTSKCIAAAPICGYCTGDHISSECENNNNRTICINCSDSNRKFNCMWNIFHSANDIACPTRQEEIQKLIQRTNYGSPELPEHIFQE